MNINERIAKFQTDLELRMRAMEALGWRPELEADLTDSGSGRMQIRYWHSPSCSIGPRSFLTCDYDRHVETAKLPAVESDPAVSELLFLAWCEKNGYRWKISTCEPHDQFTTRHIAIIVFGSEPDMDVDSEGSTPSEARARCIVAAAQEKK